MASEHECSIVMAVFIDTNLGTHIAMAVSPEITVGDLKRKLVKEHSICFPAIGQIGIDGVMVKRKSCFYYLPDSMPVNKAFQRLKGAWFLRAHVTPVVCSDKHCPPENLVAEPRNSASCSSNVIDCQNPEDSSDRPSTSDKNDEVKRKRRELSPILEVFMEELLLPVNVPKRKKSTCSHFQCNTLKRKDREQDRASSQQNGIASSPNASDSVSVTGILTRYFPDFDEVKSYPGSSSNKTIDLLENESHQADQDGNVKSNAAENSSVALDQRELPISANDALAEIPCSISPTNTCTRVARAKHGKFKTWKPMPSKTALPDSPKPKTAKGSKLQRSKARKLLPPKVPSTDKPSPSTLRNRIETSCEVGKRLIQAANDLGILTSKRKPTVSSCKSKVLSFPPPLLENLSLISSDIDD